MPVDLFEFVEAQLACQETGDVSDAPRLGRQLGIVLELMLPGDWWTLAALATAAQASAPSVSARIRDLRKDPLNYVVSRRRTITPGVFEYRINKEATTDGDLLH